MLSLKGKSALVTGAASGFGLEFSKLLASDGINLVLVDINASGLSKVRQSLTHTYNVEVETMVCDLSLPQSALEVYTGYRDRNIEILINNAGFGLFGHFSHTNWKMEENMIGLHILTLTKLTKLFFADMANRGSGIIMNVSSIAAFQPGPLMAVYYASKAYILYFTEALANEARGTGVSITAFCPGQTNTDFQKTVAINSGARLSRSPWLDDLSKTARKGYQAMKAGKIVYIPWAKNKILAQLYRIMPRKTATSFIRFLQEKIRKEENHHSTHPD